MQSQHTVALRLPPAVPQRCSSTRLSRCLCVVAMSVLHVLRAVDRRPAVAVGRRVFGTARCWGGVVVGWVNARQCQVAGGDATVTPDVVTARQSRGAGL